MKTKQEIEVMPEEERRIATAQLCGWTWTMVPPDHEMEDAILGRGKYKGVPGYPIKSDFARFRCWTNPAQTLYSNPPDYLHSLEAMHEAENQLPPLARDLYANLLCNLIEPHLINGRRPENIGAPYLAWPGVFQMVHATAEQRNLAFLMTML